jgi:hypothetical protein
MLFSQYLIGVKPTVAIRERYQHAVQHAIGAGQIQSVGEDEELQFALRHPWAIGWLDAAAAFRGRDSQLRRRLYLLFAILEATPEYSPGFLSKRRGLWYLIVIGLVGIRAACRVVAGSILIKVARLA